MNILYIDIFLCTRYFKQQVYIFFLKYQRYTNATNQISPYPTHPSFFENNPFNINPNFKGGGGLLPYCDSSSIHLIHFWKTLRLIFIIFKESKFFTNPNICDKSSYLEKMCNDNIARNMTNSVIQKSAISL